MASRGGPEDRDPTPVRMLAQTSAWGSSLSGGSGWNQEEQAGGRVLAQGLDLKRSGPDHNPCIDPAIAHHAAPFLLS
jgi:hypothetical protein